MGLFNAALPACALTSAVGVGQQCRAQGRGAWGCCMRATGNGTTRFDSRGVSSGAVDKWRAAAEQRQRGGPGGHARARKRRGAEISCGNKAQQKWRRALLAACWRLEFLHMFLPTERCRRCERWLRVELGSGSPPATQSLLGWLSQGSAPREARGHKQAGCVGWLFRRCTDQRTGSFTHRERQRGVSASQPRSVCGVGADRGVTALQRAVRPGSAGERASRSAEPFS